MGNTKVAIFKIDNEMELLTANIDLGNENYKLEEEARELIRKITNTEENIIKKISKANKGNGFSMILLNDNTRKS